MPTSYTHYYVAKEVLSKLSPPLRGAASKCLDAYYFGAQGPDFCFFIQNKKRGGQNFGRFLHRDGGYGFFRILTEFSSRNHAVFAYALGYITHYAVDVAAHPYVYFHSGKSKLKHARMEGGFDKYLALQSLCKTQETTFLQSLKPSKETVAETFNAFAKYAETQGYHAFSKVAFSRAISLFNAYTVAAFRFYKQAKPPFPKEILFNESHSVWHYPNAPEKRLNDSVFELLNGAMDESLRLIVEFSNCVDEKKAPPRELFGKNYVSGLL
ncbi:MAG: zinc dependent phospholipase C family protein [Clostridia bacterium]|nr:zinc dependent phospholipase C family protein [Clostridia bacterium]